MDSPIRVFASYQPPSGRELIENTGKRQSSRVREIRVTGTAELRYPADRASVRFSVGNRKDSVNEVTSSVSRRLDYILQCLRQYGIKEEDTAVRKFLQRGADVYLMDAEVVVTFSDFEKMETVCSVLLEKLDNSVFVGRPCFYHSPEGLSELRRRACLSAVENAQQKANDMSDLLGQTLGPPLLITEEETKERRNEDEQDGRTGKNIGSLCHLPLIPTVTAFSLVSVSFSLQEGHRKKL